MDKFTGREYSMNATEQRKRMNVLLIIIKYVRREKDNIRVTYEYRWFAVATLKRRAIGVIEDDFGI